MRLIDADKLIELLEISECETCKFGGEYCVDCKFIDAHRVLSAIESLPTANEWIPVSERLPEAKGEYLTFDKDKQICNENFEFDEEGIGHFGFWNYEQTDFIERDNYITAWMPIPEHRGNE